MRREMPRIREMRETAGVNTVGVSPLFSSTSRIRLTSFSYTSAQSLQNRLSISTVRFSISTGAKLLSSIAMATDRFGRKRSPSSPTANRSPSVSKAAL